MVIDTAHAGLAGSRNLVSICTAEPQQIAAIRHLIAGGEDAFSRKRLPACGS